MTSVEWQPLLEVRDAMQTMSKGRWLFQREIGIPAFVFDLTKHEWDWNQVSVVGNSQ